LEIPQGVHHETVSLSGFTPRFPTEIPQSEPLLKTKFITLTTLSTRQTEASGSSALKEELWQARSGILCFLRPR